MHTIDQLNKQIAALEAVEKNDKPPTMMHMEEQVNRAREDASVLRFQLIELQVRRTKRIYMSIDINFQTTLITLFINTVTMIKPLPRSISSLLSLSSLFLKAKKMAIEGQSKIDTETIVLLRAKLTMYENNAMSNGSMLPQQQSQQPQQSSSARHLGTSAYGDSSSSSSSAAATKPTTTTNTSIFSPPPPPRQSTSSPHPSSSSSSSSSQQQQQQQQQSPYPPPSSRNDRMNDERVKAVQTALQRFANDPQFITDLRRPLVLKAMKCWGGEDISYFTEEDLDAIRMDPGVIR